MENITAMKMNELDLKCINIDNLTYELLSEKSKVFLKNIKNDTFI